MSGIGSILQLKLFADQAQSDRPGVTPTPGPGLSRSASTGSYVPGLRLEACVPPQVVAHRGVTGEVPENTIPAFEQAIQVGADGVELDVRLTSDGVPVVFHYFYLDGFTTGQGPLHANTRESLRRVGVIEKDRPEHFAIPTLREVLQVIAGRIDLEIELKGPEPELAEATAEVLSDFRAQWPSMELMSFEPLLLRSMQELCSVPVDLLTHRSESWMKGDYVAYVGLHRARLAGARAVHLHPTQLSVEVVEAVRAGGIDVHSWDVNDREAFELMLELEIPRFTTDRASEILRWREGVTHEPAV